MKKTVKESIFTKAFILSDIYRKISFPLFNELKEDLPDYLITEDDVSLLGTLAYCYSIMGKKRTMENILNVLNRLHENKEECDALYSIHCDPYELFIDAGWIDNKLNILLK